MISSYIRRQRIVNGSLTTLMIVAGLAMIAFASINIVSAVNAKPSHKASFAAALEKRCQEALGSTGFVSIKGNAGAIRARGHSLENPLEMLANASVAIQQCAGYKLDTFCMGSECSNGVINFDLKPMEASKR